jgi:hypothetical protein
VTEIELTDDVDLCRPDGHLNQAAVGWSRRPVHNCALPRSWGRRKRWDFWGVTGPGCALNLTYADVDYVGIADVWFCDLESGDSVSRSATVPLARGMALPDTVGGAPLRYAGNKLELSMTEVPEGTRLVAASRNFEADILVREPKGHESLSVVIPWSSRRFQYTTKDVARPAEGEVHWNGNTYAMQWGCLDFGRGKWPYRTRWNWGAGAGIVDGTTVGLQLGGKWTVGTGMTENALSVAGRLTKVHEELEWTYDRSDWLQPWTIRTPESDQVDLTFTPVHDKVSRLQAGIAAQKVHQCFGTYAGRIVPDDGPPLTLADITGWAEEATWRW